MAYDEAIPQANDVLSQSQGQILANFTAINSGTVGFGVDHVKFDAASNQGKHQFVTFNNVAADPVGLTFQQSRLYTKSFGTAPNRASEVYFADVRETSGQLIQLVPSIKAICRFTFTGVAGAQSIISTNTLNLNVASVTYNNITNTITVTFSSALDYNTYFVFFGAGDTSTGLVATTAGFSFTPLGGAGNTISFMVV